METLANKSSLYDPDLATLPIMIAEWNTSIFDAIITYQNEVLKNSIGRWIDSSILELFNKLSDGRGKNLLLKLKREGALALPCKINNMEIKVHSRLTTEHIQITITDNTELNRLRDLEQRSKIIDSFLMLGSHELKTPLNSIIGMTNLLIDEEENEENKELLQLILDSGNNLNRVVIKMMKHIYSYQPQDAINSIEDVNIGESIIKFITFFHKHLKDRNFKLDKSFLLDKLNVKLPEGSVSDIFTEIAINLRRNTPPAGTISIRSYDKLDNVYLEIENQGSGIPESELERVFEPFHRYQNSMNHSSGYEYNQAGVGLGLTILKRTIENAGGKIWFKNKYPDKSDIPNAVVLTIKLPGHPRSDYI